MNAISLKATDRFEQAALAWCKQYAPGSSWADVESLAACMRQDEFKKLIQPWVKVKVDVYSRTMPKILVDIETGQVTSEMQFSDADREILDQCDKAIAGVAESYRPAHQSNEHQS